MSSSYAQLPSAATHTSLDLFEKLPVLVNFDNGSVQEVYPISGVDGPTLEFEVRTDRNTFLDLSEIYLRVVVKLMNITDGEVKDVTATDRILLANNSLHSLFSNCDVSINGEQVSTSNSLYAHKAFLTTEWSHPSGCKQSILKCQQYEFESNPSNLQDIFDTREKNTKKSTH